MSTLILVARVIGLIAYSFKALARLIQGKGSRIEANYVQDFISPLENSDNLSPEYLESLSNLPDRQRRRFFEGKFSAEIDGALWPMDVIDRCRMGASDPLPDMRRVVVAIDPSGTSGDIDERSDDVGIIVAGKGTDGRYYVIEDLTCNEPPAVWAARAVNAYHRHKADRIVAERNFGGAMVEHVIKGVGGRPVNYGEVIASRGKVVRAEPISSFYAQGMVSHADLFPELEDQMSMMTTAGYMGDRSPDRVDAMVWALTELSEGLGGSINVTRDLATRRFLAPRWLGWANGNPSRGSEGYERRPRRDRRGLRRPMRCDFGPP